MGGDESVSWFVVQESKQVIEILEFLNIILFLLMPKCKHIILSFD